MIHKWLPLLFAGTMIVACSKKEGDAAVLAETASQPPTAEADAPAAAPAEELLSVSKETTLPIAPAELWAKVGDFNGLNTWHPAIAKSEIVSGINNEVGAHRKLTLADGAVIVEELAARDDAGMRMTYTIVEAPLPVTDYRSMLSVSPAGEGSKLTWSSTFKAAAGTEPAKASEIIGGIYQAGINNLTKPAGG